MLKRSRSSAVLAVLCWSAGLDAMAQDTPVATDPAAAATTPAADAPAADAPAATAAEATQPTTTAPAAAEVGGTSTAVASPTSAEWRFGPMLTPACRSPGSNTQLNE